MMFEPTPELGADRDGGFTLIELLIVVAIVSIITAIASVGLLRSRAAANETAAIASVRVISSAQNAYAIACGRGAYAPTLVVLGTPPVPGQAAFISTDLSSSLTPLKAGYQFAVTAGAGSVAGPLDCNGGPTVSAYYSSAVPLSVVSGNRSFATTANGTIWQLAGGTAPTQPFGPPATMIK